jgi:hypothetical protein
VWLDSKWEVVEMLCDTTLSQWWLPTLQTVHISHKDGQIAHRFKMHGPYITEAI